METGSINLLLSAYGQSGGSPLRTGFGSRVKHGRLWQGGTYAAITGSRRQASIPGLCVQCLHPRVRKCSLREGATDTTPAILGVMKTQLGIEPPARLRPKAALHGARLRDAIERARYRSHSSFVGGRDEYLDANPRQGRAPSLTERLHRLAFDSDLQA